MRKLTVAVIIVWILAGLSFIYGQIDDIRMRNAESEITNCPPNHTCLWTELDTTTGTCLKNCLR